TAWPLPPPITTNDDEPAVPRPKQKSRENTIELSAAELETLEVLQTRCKELGVKIRKNKLLAAGLQLLATAPTGKLLAMVGPLETSSNPVKIKKRKAPPRA
ncbi:MAG: hypothetical protein JO002_14560, partial [Burkholderiaceae bacterium]|nr:hypothetical protein [Burkholderiaceae bacterium]